MYGGGGITPDTEVPEPKLNPFQETLAQEVRLFQLRQTVPGRKQRTIPRNFEVTRRVLEHFQKFLGEQEIPFTESEVAANLDYIRQNIKLELYLSVFGMDEAYKLEASADVQIQKAIQLLPQAAALQETAKQVIARKESR